MAEPAEKLSADDLLPIAKKLPRAEQVRLAELLLRKTGPDDMSAVAARRLAAIGRHAGKGFIADDFDSPLPPEIQRYFEGEDDEEAR